MTQNIIPDMAKSANPSVHELRAAAIADRYVGKDGRKPKPTKKTKPDGRKDSSSYHPGWGPPRGDKMVAAPEYVAEMPDLDSCLVSRKFDENICRTIIADAMLGHSLTATCGLLGIARSTLSDWEGRFPALADAISRARVIRLRSWESSVIDIKLRGGDSTRFAATQLGLLNTGSDDWKKDKPSDINVTVSLAALIGESMKVIEAKPVLEAIASDKPKEVG